MDRYNVDHAHPIFNLALPFNSRETINPLPPGPFGHRICRYATPSNPLGRSPRDLG
jgi:hypothetical protein